MHVTRPQGNVKVSIINLLLHSLMTLTTFEHHFTSGGCSSTLTWSVQEMCIWWWFPPLVLILGKFLFVYLSPLWFLLRLLFFQDDFPSSLHSSFYFTLLTSFLLFFSYLKLVLWPLSTHFFHSAEVLLC